MKHFSQSDNYTGRKPDGSSGRVKLSRLKHQLPPQTQRDSMETDLMEASIHLSRSDHVTVTSDPPPPPTRPRVPPWRPWSGTFGARAAEQFNYPASFDKCWIGATWARPRSNFTI